MMMIDKMIMMTEYGDDDDGDGNNHEHQELRMKKLMRKFMIRIAPMVVTMTMMTTMMMATLTMMKATTMMTPLYTRSSDSYSSLQT